MTKITQDDLLGWELVDNSGDGGPFGYHVRLIAQGRIALLLSGGGAVPDGNGFYRVVDEWLYPVTFFNKDVPVSLGVQHLNGFKPMTVKDWVDPGPEQGDLMADTHKHELVFMNLAGAQKFANFLAMFLDPDTKITI